MPALLLACRSLLIAMSCKYTLIRLMCLIAHILFIRKPLKDRLEPASMYVEDFIFKAIPAGSQHADHYIRIMYA